MVAGNNFIKKKATEKQGAAEFHVDIEQLLSKRDETDRADNRLETLKNRKARAR